MSETSKIKVLIAASEFEPFTDIGYLGRVVTNLSMALVNGYVKGKLHEDNEWKPSDESGGLLGELDVRVVIPKYACIPEQYADEARPVVEFDSTLGRRTDRCKVFKTIYRGVPVYMIECDDYFNREQVYSSIVDDIERYSAFCNAVLGMVSRIGFEPDIIQCHDWQMSFIPTLHRTNRNRRASDKNFKTLFVIHNMQYQGVCSRYDILDLLDLSSDFFTPATLEFYGQANSLKGGLLFSNRLATVSSNYAREIQHAYYGENLEGIIRSRSTEISGIMCGIDDALYDPETDAKIFRRYNARSARENKAVNKRALQEQLGFEQNPDTPLVVVMSDVLDYDKGIDLVKFVFDDILALGVQVIFASKGKSEYHDYFMDRAASNPGRVAYVQYCAAFAGTAFTDWDETGDMDTLAADTVPVSSTAAAAASVKAKTVAVPGESIADGVPRANAPAAGPHSGIAETMLICGSDILLRPSRVEPCGEKHLVALKYGTVPVVRETGGLKDVVVSYNDETGEGNGFSFYNYNAHDMLFALNRAVGVYRGDRDAWARLVAAAMRVDMTWDGTAGKYVELYRTLQSSV